MSDDTQTTQLDPRDVIIARLSVENEQLRREVAALMKVATTTHDTLSTALKAVNTCMRDIVPI